MSTEASRGYTCMVEPYQLGECGEHNEATVSRTSRRLDSAGLEGELFKCNRGTAAPRRHALKGPWKCFLCDGDHRSKDCPKMQVLRKLASDLKKPFTGHVMGDSGESGVVSCVDGAVEREEMSSSTPNEDAVQGESGDSASHTDWDSHGVKVHSDTQGKLGAGKAVAEDSLLVDESTAMQPKMGDFGGAADLVGEPASDVRNKGVLLPTKVPKSIVCVEGDAAVQPRMADLGCVADWVGEPTSGVQNKGVLPPTDVPDNIAFVGDVPQSIMGPSASRRGKAASWGGKRLGNLSARVRAIRLAWERWKPRRKGTLFQFLTIWKGFPDGEDIGSWRNEGVAEIGGGECHGPAFSRTPAAHHAASQRSLRQLAMTWRRIKWAAFQCGRFGGDRIWKALKAFIDPADLNGQNLCCTIYGKGIGTLKAQRHVRRDWGQIWLGPNLDSFEGIED